MSGSSQLHKSRLSSPNNCDFQTSKQEPINKNQPLKRFFSQYSAFQYQPRNSPVTEFKRLCKEYRWEKDGREEKAARYELNVAMVKEFNSLYGSDQKDIKNWYKLCHVLRIEPAPNTVKKCSAVRATVTLRGSFDFSFLVPGCLDETC